MGGILRANGAGVLSVGDVPANNGIGRLTAGGATNMPGELIFNVQDGGGNKTTTQLILNATIVDNGSGPVTTTFTGGGAVAVNST